jgi:hypothetical protein
MNPKYRNWVTPTEELVNKSLNFCAEFRRVSIVDSQLEYEEEFFRVYKVRQSFEREGKEGEETCWYIVGDCVPQSFNSPEIQNYADALAVYMLQLNQWVLAAGAKRLDKPGADFALVFRYEDGEFLEHKRYDKEFQSWFDPRFGYVKWHVMEKIYRDILHPELLQDVKNKCGIIDN